jgi:hypothetical protein
MFFMFCGIWVIYIYIYINELCISEWPFGNGDLEVRPIFHMVSCEVGNLEVAVPEPEFV